MKAFGVVQLCCRPRHPSQRHRVVLQWLVCGSKVSERLGMIAAVGRRPPGLQQLESLGHPRGGDH
jgi:hypothetical protein